MPRAGAGGGGQHPQPRPAQPVHQLVHRDPGHDGKVEQRSGRRAHALGVEGIDAVGGEQHGVGAGRVRAAKHRAGVPRVTDLGEHRQQRGLPAAGRSTASSIEWAGSLGSAHTARIP